MDITEKLQQDFDQAFPNQADIEKLRDAAEAGRVTCLKFVDEFVDEYSDEFYLCGCPIQHIVGLFEEAPEQEDLEHEVNNFIVHYDRFCHDEILRRYPELEDEIILDYGKWASKYRIEVGSDVTMALATASLMRFEVAS